VFTTNATCVGPFGVTFTEAGSRTQLIEGAGAPSAVVTEHPTCDYCAGAFPRG
jgi:hypothetical protein